MGHSHCTGQGQGMGMGKWVCNPLISSPIACPCLCAACTVKGIIYKPIISGPVPSSVPVPRLVQCEWAISIVNFCRCDFRIMSCNHDNKTLKLSELEENATITRVDKNYVGFHRQTGNIIQEILQRKFFFKIKSILLWNYLHMESVDLLFLWPCTTWLKIQIFQLSLKLSQTPKFIILFHYLGFNSFFNGWIISFETGSFRVRFTSVALKNDPSINFCFH